MPVSRSVLLSEYCSALPLAVVIKSTVQSIRPENNLLKLNREACAFLCARIINEAMSLPSLQACCYIPPIFLLWS